MSDRKTEKTITSPSIATVVLPESKATHSVHDLKLAPRLDSAQSVPIKESLWDRYINNTSLKIDDLEREPQNLQELKEITQKLYHKHTQAWFSPEAKALDSALEEVSSSSDFKSAQDKFKHFKRELAIHQENVEVLTGRIQMASSIVLCGVLSIATAGSATPIMSLMFTAGLSSLLSNTASTVLIKGIESFDEKEISKTIVTSVIDGLGSGAGRLFTYGIAAKYFQNAGVKTAGLTFNKSTSDAIRKLIEKNIFTNIAFEGVEGGMEGLVSGAATPFVGLIFDNYKQDPSALVQSVLLSAGSRGLLGAAFSTALSGVVSPLTRSSHIDTNVESNLFSIREGGKPRKTGRLIYEDTKSEVLIEEVYLRNVDGESGTIVPLFRVLDPETGLIVDTLVSSSKPPKVGANVPVIGLIDNLTNSRNTSLLVSSRRTIRNSEGKYEVLLYTTENSHYAMMRSVINRPDMHSFDASSEGINSFVDMNKVARTVETFHHTHIGVPKVLNCSFGASDDVTKAFHQYVKTIFPRKIDLENSDSISKRLSEMFDSLWKSNVLESDGPTTINGILEHVPSLKEFFTNNTVGVQQGFVDVLRTTHYIRKIIDDKGVVNFATGNINDYFNLYVMLEPRVISVAAIDSGELVPFTDLKTRDDIGFLHEVFVPLYHIPDHLPRSIFTEGSSISTGLATKAIAQMLSDGVASTDVKEILRARHRQNLTGNADLVAVYDLRKLLKRLEQVYGEEVEGLVDKFHSRIYKIERSAKNNIDQRILAMEEEIAELTKARTEAIAKLEKTGSPVKKEDLPIEISAMDKSLRKLNQKSKRKRGQLMDAEKALREERHYFYHPARAQYEVLKFLSRNGLRNFADIVAKLDTVSKPTITLKELLQLLTQA
ncbi:MAG: hypothetical protein KBC84_07705 [Proteobacteria bacterium]|nr:hypothetical protein [Pseudomonadota bacterium]